MMNQAHVLPPPVAEEKEESTSGVSTFDSSHRPPDVQRYERLDNRDLYSQLREVEEENRRLLQKLIESQREYNEIIKSQLEEKKLQIEREK